MTTVDRFHCIALRSSHVGDEYLDKLRRYVVKDRVEHMHFGDHLPVGEAEHVVRGDHLVE